MTQDEMQALVQAAVAAVLAQQGNGSPKAKSGQDLSKKDNSLIRGFKAKGYKDVVLMDRTDPTKPFNVRPFKGWLEQGRIVRKGERGVRGLFHVSQTDPVTAAPAKPKEAPKPTADLVAAAVSKLMANASKPVETKPETQPAA